MDSASFKPPNGREKRVSKKCQVGTQDFKGTTHSAVSSYDCALRPMSTKIKENSLPPYEYTELGASCPTPTQSTCLYYDHDNEASKCVNTRPFPAFMFDTGAFLLVVVRPFDVFPVRE